MIRCKTVNSNYKVWKIDIDENKKIAEVQIASSRKVKEENSYDKRLIDKEIAKNGYVNTNWFNVRFIGKAFNQISSYELKEGDTITNLNITFEKEPYWDSENEQVAYPKNVKITVWEFELPNGTDSNGSTTTTPKNFDKAPIVEEGNNKKVESTTPEDIDIDEEPF